MEFVAGVGLAELTNRAPQPPDEVARIGAEMAKALAALHRQKVVHLDLKPENIILAERGAVPFGLRPRPPCAELPDLLGEESSVPMGTAAQYVAGTGAGREVRSRERYIRAGPRPLSARHRREPIQASGHLRRNEAQALPCAGRRETSTRPRQGGWRTSAATLIDDPGCGEAACGCSGT
ncbi:protein kinase domain-containing protein [Mesorhizobium atlanticum]